MIISKSFTQADLNVDNQLIWIHDLLTTEVVVMLFDNEGVQQETSGIFELGNPSGGNWNTEVTLSLNNEIDGIWTALISYTAPGEVIITKKIFEQNVYSAPLSSEDRFALGKAATTAYNITVGEFISYLLGVFNTYYLQISNNLSDIIDKVAARNNLQVYSKVECNNTFVPNESVLGPGYILAQGNSTAFAPTVDYDPATKKYVDDAVGLIDKGIESIGDIGGTGYKTVSISTVDSAVPKMIIGQLRELSTGTSNGATWCVGSVANNGFNIEIKAFETGQTQNLEFTWKLISY